LRGPLRLMRRTPLLFILRPQNRLVLSFYAINDAARPAAMTYTMLEITWGIA
jgi:hypothetical protein